MPMEKTMQESMIPILRPKKSAMGAEANAPKTVPTERMETTRDFLDVEMEQGLPPPNVHSLEGDMRRGKKEKRSLTSRSWRGYQK